MTGYTTRGSVRGCCGHNHKTIEAAAKCAKKDDAACKRQRGYSDRSVVRRDGEELSEYEVCAAVEYRQ